MTRDRVAVVDRARLVGSARVRDGFYSTFVVRRLSRHLTYLALRLGLRPNEVTVISMALGIGAALLFARGDWGTTVIAALLLQVSLMVDCVDGEVARYTGRFTPVGAWLDGVGDRVKEYSVYAGLAAGYDVWAMAAAMLVVQVFRHHVDFGFAAEPHAAAGPTTALPTTLAVDGAMLGRRAVALSESTSARPALMWAKRVVIMPIGERWLVISVASVIGGGRLVFWVLLVSCSVALLYTTTGRVLRALARSRSPLDPHQLSVMTALLPPPLEELPAALTRQRLGGIVPAKVRAGELAAVLAVAAHQHAALLPLAYALAAVIAVDGYDVVYRLRQAQDEPATWRKVALLGALPRLAVVLTVLLTLGDGRRGALAVLAAAFALVCAAEISTWLRRAGSTS